MTFSRNWDLSERDCYEKACKEEISAAPTKTLEKTPDELTKGKTFASRYEVIEELGKGSMGKVYRVFDKKIKEEVARGNAKRFPLQG